MWSSPIVEASLVSALHCWTFGDSKGFTGLEGDPADEVLWIILHVPVGFCPLLWFKIHIGHGSVIRARSWQGSAFYSLSICWPHVRSSHQGIVQSRPELAKRGDNTRQSRLPNIHWPTQLKRPAFMTLMAKHWNGSTLVEQCCMLKWQVSIALLRLYVK